jgi:ParB-like chromosome segregation protein Spo0J
MATALKPTSDAWNADGTPRVFGDVFAVDAAEVDASKRLRPIDTSWATALGQIVLAEGQLTPIQVSRNRGKGKPWILIAGGHRHAAAELFLDLNPLRAIEVEGGELMQRQAEISENLHRRDLNPIDRATFIAELHDVLRARSGLDPSLSPQQIAVNARWQKELAKAAGDAWLTMSHAYGFSDQIAEQSGLSLPTIKRDLMLARRLSPLVVDRLRAHPIARNATQLRALAKLDPAEQTAVVDRLVAGAKSVAEALALLRDKPKAAPEDKRLSAFIGAFARMSLTEKKGALAQLAGMLPAGFRLAQGEEA